MVPSVKGLKKNPVPKIRERDHERRAREKADPGLHAKRHHCRLQVFSGTRRIEHQERSSGRENVVSQLLVEKVRLDYDGSRSRAYAVHSPSRHAIRPIMAASTAKASNFPREELCTFSSSTRTGMTGISSSESPICDHRQNSR